MTPTKTNGEKQLLWKVVGVLMTILMMVGAYVHADSVKHIDNLELKIEKLETQATAQQTSIAVMTEILNRLETKIDRLNSNNP